MPGPNGMEPLLQPGSSVTQEESSTHERGIEALAQAAHVPIDHVAQLYERELTVLTVGARITGFLPILIARNLWREQPYDSHAHCGLLACSDGPRCRAGTSIFSYFDTHGA